MFLCIFPIIPDASFLIFDSLDRTEVAFTIFVPTHVFITHALEQSRYSHIDRENKILKQTSQFVRAYKQMFSCDFWSEIIRVSVPHSFALTYARKFSEDERTQSNIHACMHCLFIFLLQVLAFFEKCFYIVCALVNICVNVIFTIIQIFCPVLKYFFTGYAQSIHRESDTLSKVVPRFT